MLKRGIPSTPKVTAKLTYKKKCNFSNEKKFNIYTWYIKITRIVFSRTFLVFDLAHTKNKYCGFALV